MGRIIGLELFNFKSYRGVNRIGFGTSCFTSIIGPNGSGKSNMMDAISFVLGVKTTHLRSSNLKDLIYRGRKTADNNLGDSEDNVDDIDPTRAHVLCVYERSDGELLNLQRSIGLSGTSEYRINDQIVTALHYSTVLKSENILIKARNFLVFQGDVELIASQSPRELSQLFETISGSNELSRSYDDLKQEYDVAHEKLLQVLSRRRVIKDESKQYENQMSEQRLFEEKIKQKLDIIKIIALYKAYHNEKRHFDLVDQLDLMNQQVEKLTHQLTVEEKVYNNEVSKYTDSALLAKKEDDHIDSLAEKIEDLKRECIPLQANKRATEAKIKALKSKITILSSDIVKQERIVAVVKKQLKETEAFQKDFIRKLEKSTSSTSQSISLEAHQQYKQLRNEYLARGGSEFEQKFAVLVNEKDSVEAIINSFANQKTNREQRLSDLEFIIENDLQIQLNSTEEDLKATEASIELKSQQRTKLIQLKEESKYEELALNSKLRDILVEMDELSSEERESKKQKRLRENVLLLKRLFPNDAVKGLVYDLVHPIKQNDDIALLVALGQHLDSIIVESTEIAHKCIEILKDRRSGVATFIPLDSVVTTESLNLHSLRHLHNGARPCIDIVEYDQALAAAFAYIFGNTLVVDNIVLARELKWSSKYPSIDSKLVCLDGSVIHKSGLMSGGISDKKQTAVKTWDKRKWNKLSDKKDELMAKLNKLNSSSPRELDINSIADEINGLDTQVLAMKNQITNQKRIIKERYDEAEYEKQSIKELVQKVKERELEIIQIDSKIGGVEEEMKRLQSTVYGDFCTYNKLESIEDYENLYGSSLRTREREKSKFTRAIMSLRSTVAFEEERLEETTNRKKAVETEIEDLQNDILKQDEENRQLYDKIDNLEAELEVNKGERKKVDKQLKESMKYIKHLESNKQAVESELNGLSKKIVSMEEVLNNVDMDRASLLKNCKIDNVNIPLKKGLLESITLGENSEDLTQEIYAIEIDYEMLEPKYKRTFNSRIEGELNARQQDIIEQLEKLTPNVNAVERLKDAEKKLLSFEKDYTNARHEESQILERFNDVKQQRHDLFMKAFKHVSERISNIYDELTRSSTSGSLNQTVGSAYLTLEDEDEPYNHGIRYHAMPPNKRFKEMELLSGGEKSMAALALLFAIQSYVPSPFFVLDEVDAALDNANVEKLGSYIQKYSSPELQFIVISLKNSLYELSDSLVGIYRDQTENSSKTLTVDLTSYAEASAV